MNYTKTSTLTTDCSSSKRDWVRRSASRPCIFVQEAVLSLLLRARYIEEVRLSLSLMLGWKTDEIDDSWP